MFLCYLTYNNIMFVICTQTCNCSVMMCGYYKINKYSQFMLCKLTNIIEYNKSIAIYFNCYIYKFSSIFF